MSSTSIPTPFHFPSVMRSPGTKRRFVLLFLVVACLLTLFFLGSLRHSRGSVPSTLPTSSSPGAQTKGSVDLTGHVIAPKLGNETAKAELGHAAWKVLHTTFARFPDHPTKDEQEALRQYIYLFQRLYPCGECAEHFGKLLEKFPPQVSSRSAAAAWGCHVHNEVNKRLKKELFDCSKIGDFYDCGCADDGKEEKNDRAKSADEATHAGSEESSRKPQLELERDGWTRGG